MKKLIFISIVVLSSLTITTNAQQRNEREMYGKTLNLNAGIGYFTYLAHPEPVVSLNFELDVVRNFTLAPFIGAYSYQNKYYWRNPDVSHDNYRYYNYRITVVPIGVKGTYYFDELLKAGSKWDFYAAASVGVALYHSVWDSGYYGDKNVYTTPGPLYTDAHIGAEYHINAKAGVFTDLSVRVSTLGLAIHF